MYHSFTVLASVGRLFHLRLNGDCLRGSCTISDGWTKRSTCWNIIYIIQHQHKVCCDTKRSNPKRSRSRPIMVVWYFDIWIYICDWLLYMSVTCLDTSFINTKQGLNLWIRRRPSDIRSSFFPVNRIMNPWGLDDYKLVTVYVLSAHNNVYQFRKKTNLNLSLDLTLVHGVSQGTAAFSLRRYVNNTWSTLQRETSWKVKWGHLDIIVTNLLG